MEAWEIYSLGDIDYLKQIYLAIAMIANTGTLVTLGMIGFMICLLLVGVQGIMSGASKVPYQNLLLAFIAWMLMFGTPSVNVALIDKYSGRTEIVSDIPMGVAIPQSILTRLGIGATRMMEQGFSHPQMADAEFGSTLNAIVDLRTLAGVSSDPEVVRLQQNTAYYLEACAQFVLRNDNVNLQEALVDGDALSFVRNDTDNISARHRLPTPDAEGNDHVELTCTEAHSRLRTEYESGQFADMINRAMAGTGDTDYIDYLSSGYHRLGQDTVDATMQIRNIVMASAFAAAVTHSQTVSSNPTVAAVMEASIWQRNVQWSAEGDWFMRYIRPLVTFVEGFIVAITPVMAMLVAAGVGGMVVVFSYLKMTMWIQLWYPLLAIINLYLVMVTSRRISALSELASVPPESISGSMELITYASSWLGTAGMLAAAVPAFAYMIISKSPMAFTHLMGRMQGSDTFNEKTIAPDLIQPAPAVQMDPQQRVNPWTGSHMQGAEKDFGSAEATFSNNQRITESESHARGAREDYTNTVAAISARNQQWGAAYSRAMDHVLSGGSDFRMDEHATTQEQDQFKESAGRSIANALHIGDSETFGRNIAQRGNIGSLLALKRGAAMARKQGSTQSMKEAEGLFEKLTPTVTMTGMSSSERKAFHNAVMNGSLESAISSAIGESSGVAAGITEAYQVAARDSSVVNASTGLSQSDQETLAQSRGEMVSSQQEWSRQVEAGAGSSVKHPVDFAAMSNMMAGQGAEYIQGMRQQLTGMGLGGLYHANFQAAGARGVHGLQAQALAGLWTMTGRGGVPATTPEQMASQGEAMGMFNTMAQGLYGVGMSSPGVSATPSPGLGATLAPGSVINQVDGGLAPGNIPSREDFAGAAGGVASSSGDLARLGQEYEAASGYLEPHHQANVENVDRARDENAAEQTQRVTGALSGAYRDYANEIINNPSFRTSWIERISGQLTQGASGLWNGLDGRSTVEDHVDRLRTTGSFNGDHVLQAGYAVGYHAKNHGPNSRLDNARHNPQTLMNQGRNELRRMGFSSADIDRASPMIAAGAMGFNDPNLPQVKQIAQQVHKLDEMRFEREYQQDRRDSVR